MAEYIERKQLIRSLEDVIADYRDGHTFSTDFAATVVTDILNNVVKCLPAADVAPVRHGRWIIKHKHRGGFRRYTGIDDMGEQHTITVDERIEYDERYCSECGKQSADNFLTYCPNCGAKMDLHGECKQDGEC